MEQTGHQPARPGGRAVPNDIYRKTQRQLSTMISGRAARRVLDRSLRALGHSQNAVTASQMRDTLLGPVLRELSAILPGPGLKHHLHELGASLSDPPEAEISPTPPTSEPATAAQLINTGVGDGKQTLSSFPVVEANDEPRADEAVASQERGEATNDAVPGDDPTPADEATLATAAPITATETSDVSPVAVEPPSDSVNRTGGEPQVSAGATSTVTLAEPSTAEDKGAAPLSEERLKELVLHFARVDHVRQVAALRATGEVVEARGSAVDLAGLSSLGPSSLQLFKRHGDVRSYYLQHPQGQLFSVSSRRGHHRSCRKREAQFGCGLHSARGARGGTMKCGFRHFAIWALIGAFAIGGAFAQDQDSLLERYSFAIENLALVLEAGTEQAAEANDFLNDASNRLLALALDSSSSPALIEALNQTLERTQTSIQNRSQTDLIVQTSVLRGGFQRIVFDGALDAASEGNIELARTRLARLADDLDLAEEDTVALAAASDTNQFRLLLEAGVADAIRLRLEVTSGLVGVNDDLAYQDLAVAYGSFLMVQDSPRANITMNQGFVNAATALVDGEGAVLTEELAQLSDNLLILANAARAGRESVPQPAPTEVGPEGAEIETIEPAVALPPVATEEPTEVTPAPTEEPVAVTPEGTDGEAVEPGPESELRLEELAALFAEQQRQEAIDQLTRSLAGLGLSGTPGEELATLLHDDGFTSIGDVMRDLYRTSAQAVVTIQDGDEATAKELIAEFESSYLRYLAPLVEVQHATLHDQTLRLTERLQATLPPRSQDAVVLVSHVQEMQDALEGRPDLGPHGLMVDTSLLWTGWPRLVVIIVFGLLAFVPLYLLNLAFGGGNRNWQLVGVALFLLLPIIYEALAFIAGLVADLSGVEGFNILASYSIFENTLSQVLWAVVTSFAIIFAIAGLYGICVQFGLLGRRQATAGSATGTGTGTGTGTETREPATDASSDQSDPLVDWDEEF